MPRQARELSDEDLQQINAPGLYAVGGVAGLYLQWTSPTARSWILRKVFKWNATRADLGLGPYPLWSLEKAREKAGQWARMIDEGIDPRDEGRAAASHH